MSDRRLGHGGYFTRFQIYPSEEEEYNKRDEQATRAQASASLVALAERPDVIDVSLGRVARAWCASLEFQDGDLLEAIEDSPEAAVKALGEKVEEREDIQSGLMEDT